MKSVDLQLALVVLFIWNINVLSATKTPTAEYGPVGKLKEKWHKLTGDNIKNIEGPILVRLGPDHTYDGPSVLALLDHLYETSSAKAICAKSEEQNAKQGGHDVNKLDDGHSAKHIRQNAKYAALLRVDLEKLQKILKEREDDKGRYFNYYEEAEAQKRIKYREDHAMALRYCLTANFDELVHGLKKQTEQSKKLEKHPEIRVLYVALLDYWVALERKRSHPQLVDFFMQMYAFGYTLFNQYSVALLQLPKNSKKCVLAQWKEWPELKTKLGGVLRYHHPLQSIFAQFLWTVEPKKANDMIDGCIIKNRFNLDVENCEESEK